MTGYTVSVRQQYNLTQANILLDCNKRSPESKQREGPVQFHSSETTSELGVQHSVAIFKKHIMKVKFRGSDLSDKTCKPRPKNS